ncbi:DUF1501 domain-containing protein [Ferrimonas pelagia]|uniref:DUF1501 domain-containing protein n=1 Tax=Ferrimonas pelagia TaxID=1177826 RepID=A0ABP9ETN5_9GAMM
MNRRTLIKLLMAGAGTAMAPAWVRPAMASGGGYKALVGIMLFGGNDSFNMVLSGNADAHTDYQNARSNLALPSAELLSTGLSDQNGDALQLHPQMPELANLMAQGNTAVICNCGTLIEPITREAILAGQARLPEFLFSHNSQQIAVESGVASTKNSLGWGGRLMDMLSANAGSGFNAITPLFSLVGNRKWARSAMGNNVISAGSIPSLDALHHSPLAEGYQSLLSLPLQSAFEQELSSIQRNARTTSDTLEELLTIYPSEGNYPDNNGLASQLKTVESIIRSNALLGHGRQLFLVGMGGFDNHDDLLARHAPLMQTLSQALAAFQNSLTSLGLDQQVTTFTMSDFGRRLLSNGDGTDHGWGGNQLVMGGAVKGGAYGLWPTLALEGPDSIYNGRMIPTTSVDQVAATLSQWMGASTDQLNQLFPELYRFNSPTLDFMA